MTRQIITRRLFNAGLLACGGLLATDPLLAQSKAPSVGVVIGRIKAGLSGEGVRWTEPTVDTLKIGNPDAPVTGVVCTFMATLELMHAAVKRGANFIVSHEPIFYNHPDRTDFLTNDPVYLEKVRYAQANDLAVWRFHDHWHRHRPEPMSMGTTGKLGWTPYVNADNRDYPNHFTLPPMTLRALAAHMAKTLPSASVRVIGDPGLMVSRATNVGHTIDGVIAALETADVVIAPEAREWDAAEYMRDLIDLGGRKGIILLAHERAEEDGMDRCAQWLAPMVPEVAVSFISSGEPFRTAPWRQA